MAPGFRTKKSSVISRTASDATDHLPNPENSTPSANAGSVLLSLADKTKMNKVGKKGVHFSGSKSDNGKFSDLSKAGEEGKEEAVTTKVMSPASGNIRDWTPADSDNNLTALKVSTTISQINVGPDVDVILSLLGNWLFESAMNDKKGFSYGRAEAIGCLGRLFCGRSYRTGLKLEYAMQFFSVIKFALSDVSKKEL